MAGWSPKSTRKAELEISLSYIKDAAVAKQTTLRDALESVIPDDVYCMVCSMAYSFEELLVAGNAKALSYLINSVGANVNKVHEDQRPLHIAIAYKYVDVVKVLLSSPKIDVFAEAWETLRIRFLSPFEMAIITEQPDIIKAIADAEPRVLQVTNPSPLNLAIEWRNRQIVNLLLDMGCYGAEHKPDHWHRVPLCVEENKSFLAATGRHESCPALLFAMGRGNFAIASMLLDRLPQRTPDELSDALVMARFRHNDRLTTTLIAAGATDDQARVNKFQIAIESRRETNKFLSEVLWRARAEWDDQEQERQRVRDMVNELSKKVLENFERSKALSEAPSEAASEAHPQPEQVELVPEAAPQPVPEAETDSEETDSDEPNWCKWIKWISRMYEYLLLAEAIFTFIFDLFNLFFPS